MPQTFAELHLAGGFSLDAILYADGGYETDRMGGNALYASMGAFASGAMPHPHTVVGQDYPQEYFERLAALGIDTGSMRRSSLPTGVRVTFSYRADGSRSQPADPKALSALPEGVRSLFIDTTRDPHVMRESLPTREDVAGAVDAGWHLGLLPVDRFRELVGSLSGSRYLQVDAPARSELREVGLDVLAETLSDVDVFLPSTSDTDVFLPGLVHDNLLGTFHDRGARLVVLKCGEDGAIVSERGGRRWRVPVVPDVVAVDPTGAGDAFAGGFAAAMQNTGNPVVAACRGAAAASFAVAVRTPLELAGISTSEIDSRAHDLERRVVLL